MFKDFVVTFLIGETTYSIMINNNPTPQVYYSCTTQGLHLNGHRRRGKRMSKGLDSRDMALLLEILP